jgi:MGT family glycosyltransferase
MSNFLFVVPPLVGHVNPAVRVAAELRGRGHTVAFAGDRTAIRPLLAPDADAIPIYQCGLPTHVDRPPDLRGFAALKYLWQNMLLPLAEAMVDELADAVADFGPDAMVVDQQAMAGGLVAERLGIPWATSATTSSELTDPLADMPKVQAWLTDLLGDLRVRHGDPAATSDLRFSPHLVLAFTTEAMVGDVRPPHIGPVSFVGPVRKPTEATPAEPMPPGDGPLVYVSMGTTNIDVGARFVRECVAALAVRPHLRAIVADPSDAEHDVPDHIVVRRHVNQIAVLAAAGAVVSHGGHNTVCEALSCGVPLVVAPIRDDQPIIADQVTRAGAGLRLRFDRASAAQIGAAIDTVLTDPSYRKGAATIAESFRASGGAALAADGLTALVRSRAGAT